MQRRKFIKDALTGLPIIVLSPSVLSSSCKKNNSLNANDKTVIVVERHTLVVAAKKLKEIGFNVIVLESQDKVGGRLRTNRTLGVAFDEGASWIHGVTGNPITSLAQQAGMKTSLTDDNSFLIIRFGWYFKERYPLFSSRK